MKTPEQLKGAIRNIAKAMLEKTYKESEKEAIALQQKCSNVEQFVGLEKHMFSEHTMENNSHNHNTRF